MPIIIDGKKISDQIKLEIKKEIEEKNLKPGLAVVLVGEDTASRVYVRNKKLACEFVGIESHSFNLDASTTESELLDLIEKLNTDNKINGILIQLPLPKHIDKEKILNAINPEKDVDGFHPLNIGRLYTGHPGLVPCTPAGIMALLRAYDINIEGQHAVIVGRSNIVGKPISQMLLDAGATISICHSKTKDLGAIIRQADILVVAVGVAKLIKKSMIKKGAVIIDVGTNKDADGKLCGDVDFADVEDYCSAITPVPGGVGPMTIAMLMKNCMGSIKNKNVT